MGIARCKSDCCDCKAHKFQHLLSYVMCPRQDMWFHVTLNILDKASRQFQSLRKTKVNGGRFVDVECPKTSDYVDYTTINVEIAVGGFKIHLKK